MRRTINKVLVECRNASGKKATRVSGRENGQNKNAQSERHFPDFFPWSEDVFFNSEDEEPGTGCLLVFPLPVPAASF